MNTPPSPPRREQSRQGANADDARRAIAQTDALAEAFRVAAEACDARLTPNEAVGSLLPLEGLIEEAAALHAAVIALHRRAR